MGSYLKKTMGWYMHQERRPYLKTLKFFKNFEELKGQ